MLFINDLPLGLSPGTNLALYADDTKIWRSITSYQDHLLLQKDIDYLNDWARLNKMKFHPTKCKVVSIHSRPSPLSMLPFHMYQYHLGGCPLEYVENEKDLGVLVNTNFNFDTQCEALLSKASQQFGLLKRTCQFVRDVRRRRVLYLTLIRSLFEHCSPIWRPNSLTMTNNLENFQKSCIKWILSEEELSYGSYDMYIRICRQVDILPLSLRFKYNDLVLLFKVIHGLIPLDLPAYLSWFNGNSRLRTTHLDDLSLVCSLIPSAKSCSKFLEKSFFYRTHSFWNALPLEIRQLGSLSLFKSRLENHLWESVMKTDNDETNF